jgi:hypothetical protein
MRIRRITDQSGMSSMEALAPGFSANVRDFEHEKVEMTNQSLGKEVAITTSYVGFLYQVALLQRWRPTIAMLVMTHVAFRAVASGLRCSLMKTTE